MVNVSGVVPFSGIVGAPNAFAIVTSPTMSVALALRPVPKLAEVTGPETLLKVPRLLPVTSTVTEQLPLGGTIPLASGTVAGSVMLTIPAQVLAGATAVSPAGRTSENPTPIPGVKLGLPIVNARIVVPPSGITEGVNAFEIVRGSCADAVPAGQATTPKHATMRDETTSRGHLAI